MSPTSLQFFFLFIGVLVAYLSLDQPAHRRALLSAVNLGFLATFIPNWQSWVSLLVFIVGSYFTLQAARRATSDWVVALWVGIFILAFLLLKRYAFLDALVPSSLFKHSIELVGISYMLFKFIHMVVDIRQEQIHSVKLSEYANYQLAFFTLIAGPIQRFNDFQKFWGSVTPGRADQRETLLAWNRILNGMIKIGLLATVANYLYEWGGRGFSQPPTNEEALVRFAVCFYSYPVYLYFNFSGYTDIVLGCAKLLGLQLPENFDRPYLARNVVDFWSRWHISLTNWVRDYLYMSVYKWLVQKKRSLASWAGYVLTFLSLVIIGTWHGSTLNFVAFGAIHGIGATTTQIYTALLKKLLRQDGLKKYNQSQVIRGVSMFITFHFICLSFVFFPTDIQTALERLRIVMERTF